MKRARRASPARALPREHPLFPEGRPAAFRKVPPIRDLMVLTSDEDLVRWSRRRIVEVLVREANLDEAIADEIGARIEDQLQKARLHAVSTAVLRELIGAELLLLGHTAERARHARLGVSLFDVGLILRGTSGGPSGSRATDPETTSTLLAGRIKRDYALAAVLSERVSDGHLRGNFHVHDLDAVDRPLSVEVALEAMQSLAVRGHKGHACPARDAVALATRVAARTGLLSGLVSGSVGLDAINLALAPFTRSETAATDAAEALLDATEGHHRGRTEGGAALARATLYFDLPPVLAASPCWGPSGKRAGAFGEHEEGARRSACALVAAVAARTRAGERSPLELVVVVGSGFFRAPGHLAFLDRAAEAARAGAPIRFRFRRDDEGGRRLGERGLPQRSRGEPGPRRAPARSDAPPATLAAASIDLPRLAYLSGSDEEAIEARLVATLDLVAAAHIDRRVFLEELLARGAQGPLAELLAPSAGGALLRIDDALHAILPAGLNELAELAAGGPLHAGEEAMAFAERLLERLSRHVGALARKHKMRFVLQGFPAAAPAARFAKLDLRHHSPAAGHHVKGDLRSGRVHYTAGIGLDLDEPLTAQKRLTLEGRLHRALNGQAECLLPASALPPSQRASEIVMEAFLRSTVRGLRFAT